MPLIPPNRSERLPQVRNCQGGPRLEFFAGRPDAVAPAPQFGLLPDAASSVDDILARMADGGFSANEVVDLLASHSVGFQEKIDRTVAFTPFDSTVEVFDGQFFLDVSPRYHPSTSIT